MQDSQKIEPHILEKYQIIKKLGSGAYGHVWKAKSKKSGNVVALKKIFDAFQHSTDAQRTFREISILRQVNNQRIIKLQEVLASQNNKDIYLVFQYMQSDLYHLLYDGKLQPIHIKFILYQIIMGLHYLHACKLIHRDLKPSNILVNSDCSSKICDFGLVRYLGSDILNFNNLTEGVATRWYRAPQVLLGSNSYGPEADMWSIGCILGQILLKNPLFPGSCTTNQLQRILQFTGQPSQTDIKSIKAQLGEVMISEVCNGKIKKKLDIFNKVEDKLAINLVYKLLQFNPSKRLTTQQALKHQYFRQFYNPGDLEVKTINIVLQIDQNVRLDTLQYLNIIKDKFVTKTRANRQDSLSKHRKRISQSPKTFSDLKKSRVSLNKNQGEALNSRSRLNTQIYEESVNNQATCTNSARRDTNLFKQLCKQRSQKSVGKRNQYKQNKSIEQNTQKKQKQKHVKNFQSFTTVSNNIKKYAEEKHSRNFSGLTKTSKLTQQR